MRHPIATVALAASLLLSGRASVSLLDPLWAFLTSLWNAPAQSDGGCGMDPSGGCAPDARVESDGGCGMDPNGRCLESARTQSDIDCGWDPDAARSQEAVKRSSGSCWARKR